MILYRWKNNYVGETGVQWNGLAHLHQLRKKYYILVLVFQVSYVRTLSGYAYLLWSASVGHTFFGKLSKSKVSWKCSTVPHAGVQWNTDRGTAEFWTLKLRLDFDVGIQPEIDIEIMFKISTFNENKSIKQLVQTNEIDKT